LAVGLFAGVLVAGPRQLLRNRYVWSGAAIALILWGPGSPQVLLVSPPLAPVWIAGLVKFFRDHLG